MVAIHRTVVCVHTVKIDTVINSCNPDNMKKKLHKPVIYNIQLCVPDHRCHFDFSQHDVIQFINVA